VKVASSKSVHPVVPHVDPYVEHFKSILERVCVSLDTAKIRLGSVSCVEKIPTRTL